MKRWTKQIYNKSKSEIVKQKEHKSYQGVPKLQ